MAWATLATEEDVLQAGNFSDRISSESVTFYLRIGSYFVSGVIGATNYLSAKKQELDEPYNDMLRKAEACVAVSFALPALAVKTSEMGMVKQMAMARGGEYQSMSFAKEIQELAGAFMALAYFLIPSSLIQDAESYGQVWHHTFQVLFPTMDEFPTRATIHSYSEGLIQTARGFDEYIPDGVDND